MRQKNHTLSTSLILILALSSAALINTGCGGSSSSDTQVSSSSRCILVGDINASYFASSDLAPYISKYITQTLSLSDSEHFFDTIETLTSKDFIFFAYDPDTHPADETQRQYTIETLYSIYEAYELGATVVYVFPNSEDVKIMNTMLKLSLAYPDDNAPCRRFEFLAAAERPLPDGRPHTFTYVEKCSSNHEYFTNLFQHEFSKDAGISSGTSPAEDFDSYTANTEFADAEQLYQEQCERRVQLLFDWEAGLNARAQQIGPAASAAVNQLVHDAGLQDEILSIAQGVTTDQRDTFSMGFRDYYNAYMKDSTDELDREFVQRLGLNRDEVLDAYSGFSVKRETLSQYRVISVHSFDSHKDYYLVLSQVNTQPKALEIRAPNGTQTGGDVYGHSSMLGFTKTLWTDLWIDLDGNHLEHYVPDQTVNQSRSYTESSGWSTTNSVSVTAKGGRGNTGDGAGFVGEISVGCTHSSTASHTSSMTWTAQDYEIIPKPFDSGSKHYASWKLSVTYPEYSYDSDRWQFSTAAKESVTLNTEAIFRADLSESDNLKLYGRAAWNEGFAGTNSGQTAINYTHSGQVTALNFQRPLHTAVISASYEGDKTDKMYPASFLTEDSWTVSSDVDWIDLSAEAGEAGSNRLNYEVHENTTGRMRTGTITITSGNDRVLIPFTQSGGAIN